jgi:hypothetical protein
MYLLLLGIVIGAVIIIIITIVNIVIISSVSVSVVVIDVCGIDAEMEKLRFLQVFLRYLHFPAYYAETG